MKKKPLVRKHPYKKRDLRKPSKQQWRTNFSMGVLASLIDQIKTTVTQEDQDQILYGPNDTKQP